MHAIVADFLLQIRQTFVLVYKHLTQAWNHWFATIIRICIPLLTILLIYGVNNATYQFFAFSSLDSSREIPIGSLPKGKILYSLNSYRAYNIMAMLAKKNNPPLTIEPYSNSARSVGARCPYDICSSSNIESDLHKNEYEYIGGFYFSDHYVGDYTVADITIYGNWTSFGRNPFNTFDPLARKPVDLTPQLQRAVEEARIAVALNNTNLKIESSFKPLPIVKVQENVPKEILFDVVGIELYFVGLFIFTALTHFTVNAERNDLLRLLMQHHNLKDFSYWASWMVWLTIINAIGVVIMIIAGLILNITLFTHANFVVLFLLFFLTTVALSATVLFLTTCFRGHFITNTVIILALAGHLGFIVLFSIPTYGSELSLGTQLTTYSGGPGILSSFPAFNYGKIITDIAHKARDIPGKPDAQGNINYTRSDYLFVDMFHSVYNCTKEEYYEVSDCGVPPAALSMVYMVAYTLVVFVLLILFDYCLPRTGQPGRKRWFGRKKDALNVDISAYDSERFSSVLPDTDVDIVREYQYITKNLQNESVMLKMVKLSKMYPKRWWKRGEQSKNALDSVTMGAEKGSVFVLLGHNGAGKSSLINILTGMNSASAGDVLINQKSVTNELGDIRKTMGVCQQDDILFPELTGEQHLWLLGMIRGLPRSEIKKTIEERLRQVKLYKYKDELAATYSGGMKRRLGIAMALLGDPKILLLDEPTSGMDPVGKRIVWNLIRKIRHERIILLSTHSMEEADSVGDKIAILALGRLRAIGSPMHLKQRFGMGYSVHMTTSTDRRDALKEKVLEIFNTQNDEKAMASVGLQLASETTAGITYTIFRTSVEQMGYVTNLFHYLESKNALVDDFMVSHTTLEDVFLRLTHGEGMVVDAAPTWDNEQTISDLQRLVREHETTIATLTQQVKDLQEHLSQYTVDDIN